MGDGQRSPSIHDLPPSDLGGTFARKGFELQDHVAAQFCLEMADANGPSQVWCEVHDDVTLIWTDGVETVEFVQVKGDELGQLWTMAKLCERDPPRRPGTSIVEKALARDRCAEACRFRMVTARPVNKDLKPLTNGLGSKSRDDAASELALLGSEIGRRIEAFNSPNGRDAGYWTANCRWDVVHSIESVKNRNIATLRRVVERNGEYLASDQAEELYEKILTSVRLAAAADASTDLSGKKITKAGFDKWLQKTVEAMVHPALGKSGGEVMKEKMEAAGLPRDAIESALQQRRAYRRELLTPTYLTVRDRRHVQDEVAAKLQELRAQLDAGELLDDGPCFHSRCIQKLEELRVTLNPSPGLSFLLGCMYGITDRCLHRFRRAQA